MASSKEDKNKQSQPESVRERAERAIEEASKPKKKQEVAEVSKDTKSKSSAKAEIKKADKPKKEKKKRRFHIVPKFIRGAFKEIRLVTWPNAKTTTKLTIAVIIFATIFSILVSLVDYGFGKIFKKVFLNG